MVNWIVIKKISTVDDALDFIREYLGLCENREEEEDELTKDNIREALDDLGFGSINDLVGQWDYSDEIDKPCDMPVEIHGNDFKRKEVPIIIILHGHRYPETIIIYEWKNSGYGLAKEEDYQNLF